MREDEERGLAQHDMCKNIVYAKIGFLAFLLLQEEAAPPEWHTILSPDEALPLMSLTDVY